jgi:ABC-type multidrug transport system ATPase subunit
LKEHTPVVIEHLAKRYGFRYALLDVTLSVGRGEVFGLLGPNGAGKSTLLKVLATLVSPSGGSVLIDGLSLKDRKVELRRRIGYLGHEPLLYRDLTGEENLKFYYKFYHSSPPEYVQEKLDEVFELLRIGGWRHEPVRNLSRGFKKRFDFARAIIHDPELLLFDEPFSGLDMESLEVAREFVRSMEGEKTIIISTHNIEEAKELCNKAALLAKGRLIRLLEAGDIDEVSLKDAFKGGAAR